MDSLGLEVNGTWSQFSALGAAEIFLDGVSIVNYPPSLRVSASGQAKVNFGVDCWDTCTGEKWGGDYSLGVTAYATGDVPIPGMCSIFLGGATKFISNGWARKRYGRLVWACRAGALIKTYEALDKIEPKLIQALTESAVPLIEKLLRDSPKKPCELSGR